MSDIVLNTESACSNAEATSGSNSAQRCWFANGAGGIGSDCAVAHARRDGGCRSARRSARNVLRIPGIVDISEITHERAAPVCELVQVLFAKQDGACLLQPASDFRVLCWNAFFEHGAGRGGEDACGINQIFQRQRNAV